MASAVVCDFWPKPSAGKTSLGARVRPVGGTVGRLSGAQERWRTRSDHALARAPTPQRPVADVENLPWEMSLKLWVIESPQGEGIPHPALRRVEALWIGESAVDDSPSPRGEGWGEGEDTLRKPARWRMADEVDNPERS